MNPPTGNEYIITSRELEKYRKQFNDLGPQDGFVTGAQAKGFFLQSHLPPILLGQIWTLADADADGKLDLNEFSIACKLINLKLRNIELPKVLPPSFLTSLNAISVSTNATSAAPATVSAIPVPLDGMSKPQTAPIAASLPGAVPVMPPSIIPSSLPGIMPQSVQPTISATATGVAPLPQAIPGAIPVMPGGGSMSLQQSMPMGVPVLPGVVAGMPGVPGMVPPAAPVILPSATVAGQVIIPGTGVMPMQAPIGVGAVTNIGSVMPVNTVTPAIIPGVVASIETGAAVSSAKLVSPPTTEIKAVSTPTPPHSNPPSRHMSISERAPSIDSPQGEWAVKPSVRRKYTQVFNANDRTRSGFLTGAQARGLLIQSKLPQSTLALIWTLSDIDKDGRLCCDEFILAMFLCEKAREGEKIPNQLPVEWLPPSKSRQGSISVVGSRPGSTVSSRHASVSSQGAPDADPAAGLPQTSFEDKRKENFDKGQAELDRRRKLLQDQQRKEKEERERKEREEADKRERARLEAERKQQEELERQLQKQRELEQEREEQRKRELEAKEAARKELEKQRQLEWENARIAEMNGLKQREQENVLKQKAHNTQLNVELSTLNEKIKELSQKICDTRAGVTNVKSIIDGMRTTRDTSMTEMSQLKARIKEQNAKLLQLSQERAKWDAKSKMAGAISGAESEQLNAAFANKQLIIKQLKDKVENIAKEIEGKKEDINSNDEQVAEVKAELSNLMTKCEELYVDYDKQRTQVLELKYNKRNDNVSASAWDAGGSSDWDTTTSAIDHYGLSNDIAASQTTTVDTSGPAPEGFVKYRSLYEFNARNSDEISFVPGDIILVPLEQHGEPGWLAGEINGHTGWFPETYVEKIDDESAAAIAQDTYNDNSQSATVIPATTDVQHEMTNIEQEISNVVEEPYNGEVEYYIATYHYDSTEPGDLNFGAGETILVIKKDGEWWTGTIGNRTGIFPANYVQKADVGGAGIYTEQTTNGNVQTDYEINTQEQKESIEATTEIANDVSNVVCTNSNAVSAEETRTNEELDTEVSQINTQSKNQTEPGESYSRPMSRTSSMTPGMRAKRSEIAQVIAPYEATSSEQLSLTRGQLIMIRKKTETGWWEGELQAKGRRRQIGWFPATYVKVLQGGRNSGRNTPVSGSRIEMTEQILDKVIALYAYKAQNDDELSFEKDDIISVLGREEPEWWRGELNGLTGLFPSNYVGPFVTSGKDAINAKK